MQPTPYSWHLFGDVLLLLAAINTILASISGDSEISPSQLAANYSIVEELPASVTIGSLAHDTALYANYPQALQQSLRFGLMTSALKEHFVLDPSGVLTISDRKLDRDRICGKKPICLVNIQAALIEPVELFMTIKVKILLIDVNDNAPTFPQARTTLAISESVHLGDTFEIPAAEDLDFGSFDVQRYELEANGYFELVVSTVNGIPDVRLVIVRKLDREVEDRMVLRVTAFDAGQPRRSGTITLDVLVQDSNDNSPTFVTDLYNITLGEEVLSLDPIVRVSASDLDDGLNGQVVYSFNTAMISMYGDLFTVDRSTGDVYLRRALDYEQKTTYELIVFAADLGPRSLSAHATIIINVGDINDHAPNISINALKADKSIAVAENQASGTFVAYVAVEDMDAGINSELVCILQSKEFGLSQASSRIFKVVTQVALDRERQSEHRLIVACKDRGVPSQSSSKAFQISVLDANDNRPEFSQREYTGTLVENAKPGVFLIQIAASDLDVDDNARISYSFREDVKGMVFIDSRTGVITSGIAGADREKQAMLICHVVAADGGYPSLSSETIIRLEIVDMNDEAPIFSRSEYLFWSMENLQPGVVVGTVTAVDLDLPPNDSCLYSLVHSSNTSLHSGRSRRSTEDHTEMRVDSSVPFCIDPNRGVITTTARLDRELKSNYNFFVLAKNTAPPFHSSYAAISISILDVNDNAPEISHPTNHTVALVPCDSDPGFNILTVTANDLDDGDNARITFIGNEGGLFNLNLKTGELQLAQRLDQTFCDNSTSFELLVLAKDSGVPALSASVYFSIRIAPPSSKHTTSLAFYVSYEHSLALLIIVASVTVMLVSILLVGIVYVARRKKARKVSSSTKCQRLSLLTCGLKSYNVVNNTPVEQSQDITSYECSYSPSVALAKRYAQLNGRAQNLRRGLLMEGRRSGSPMYHGGAALQYRMKFCQPLLPKVENTARHPDTASRTSSEPSTSDSGRGPSEPDPLVQGSSDKSRGVPAASGHPRRSEQGSDENYQATLTLPQKSALVTPSGDMAQGLITLSGIFDGGKGMGGKGTTSCISGRYVERIVENDDSIYIHENVDSSDALIPAWV